ncbi:MAG: hypothetical protein IKE23_11625 [Exiguobacterium sp.]|nr:hypothetical protein [Exiguobacterium sp.]
MTNMTYITSEGYEAASINNNYTRESIAQAIRAMAQVFAVTTNKLAASAKLDEIESLAVSRFGYDWDEIEAIEASAY